jgi:peptidoglycan/LPS O-acetylase OafA/YrhL
MIATWVCVLSARHEQSPQGKLAMQQSAPEKRFSSESANLDFLRAVAVLAVFACHFWDTRTRQSRMGDISWHLGKLGVLMFFVHTCLVLMSSLNRMEVGGRRLFAAFYIRRFFRIYPLSVFCVLAVFFLAHNWFGLNPICHPGPLTPARLWLNLSLVSNLYGNFPSNSSPMIVPLWSLPLELQMYLVLPVLFLVLRSRPMWWSFAVWLISLPLAAVQPKLGTACLLFQFAPCFLGGIVAWRLAQNQARPPLAGWLWPGAIAAMSTIWMIADSDHSQYYSAAFGLCLGSSIPLFCEIPWHSVKVASHNVAKYSYSIYLCHFSVLLFAFRRLPHHGRLTHYFVMALLMLVLPLILYHCLEVPAIRCGKILADWISGKRIVSGATSVALIGAPR